MTGLERYGQAAAQACCVSACIITLNEEDRIEDCIRSVSWCDEVLVVDSHSTDRTRELAAALGARVIERDWSGYVEQKEFAVRAARNHWVLCIDADERVSSELRDEILALRDEGFQNACGWRMPRLTSYLGCWIRRGTWYPNWQLRLFDRQHGRWTGDTLHEKVEVDGTVRRLRSDLLHYPYRSFHEHLEIMDRYSTMTAQSLYDRGRRARISDIVLRPMVRFVRFYFLKRGFLEGWRGLLLAYMNAHYCRLRYAKLLVLERTGALAASGSLLKRRKEERMQSCE